MKISLPKAMNKLTPSFFCHFRARFLQRSPLLVAPIRHISTAIVLGLMIPVSFSLYPQLGTVGLRYVNTVFTVRFPKPKHTATQHFILSALQIKKEKLEKELETAAVSGELFYHRGL